MASVAENSVASVPLSVLAQLRDEYMQNGANALLRAPEALQLNANSPLVSGDAVRKNPDCSTVSVASADVATATAGSADARDAVAVASNTTPSRSLVTKSAPALAMEATTVEKTTSPDDAFQALTRASSFHGYPGGDTQLNESQLYRDFAQSILPAHAATPRKHDANGHSTPEQHAMDTCGTTTADKTCRTFVEGDSGFIKLDLNPSPTAASQSNFGADGFDDLLAPTQQHTQFEFAKPAAPQTPSLAGNKHGRDGELLTSATTTTASTKTPGFSQLFGGGGGRHAETLTATQLFQRTQAPSSPVPEGLRSDPIVTRPSPNINTRFSISSPEMPMSSPFVPPNSRPVTSGEPRGSYTSMLESQEQRRKAEQNAKRLRQEIGLGARFGDEDDFEDAGGVDDGEEGGFKHGRIQRVMSDQALSEWAKTRVSPRLSSSARKHRAAIDLVTPMTARRGERVEFDVSEDDEKSEVQMRTEDDRDEDEDQYEENDRYDEYTQSVLKSQDYRSEHDDDDDTSTTNDEEREGPDGNADLAAISEAPRKAPEQSAPRTAILNSQPLQKEKLATTLHRPSQHSPLSSFVPGSQYVGRTSEDQARLSSQRTSLDTRQYAASGQIDETRVPSSPPLLVAGTGEHALEDDDPTRDQAVSGIRSHSQAQRAVTADTEIPDSDLNGLEPSKQSSPPKRAHVENENENENENSELTKTTGATPSGQRYFTAQTQVDRPTAAGRDSLGVSPLKNFISQQNKTSSQSPRRLAGVRRFSEIAGAPSPPHASGETDLDVNAIMDTVLTKDDQRHVEAVSSPPRDTRRKRRRVDRRERDGFPLESGEREVGPRHANEQKQDDPLMEPVNAARAVIRGDHTDKDQPLVPPEVERDRSERGSEMPPGTPTPEEGVSSTTPNSVKARERAGAKKVSQLVVNRPRRTSEAAKKVGKQQKKKVQKANGSRKAPPAVAAAQPAIDKGSVEPSAQGAVEECRVDVIANGEDDGSGGLERALTTRQDATTVEASSTAVQRTDQVQQQSEPNSRPVHRLFALFKGMNYNSFYPATWLGCAPDGRTYRVQFDDDTVVSIGSHLVCNLDLRLDDPVKVDFPKMRGKTYVIKGFGSSAAIGHGTDSSGHRIAKIQVKGTRSSSEGAERATSTLNEVLEVEIDRIYLPHSLWRHYLDRTFAPPSTRGLDDARDATPLTGASGAELETPNSRTRRPNGHGAKLSASRTSHLREEGSNVAVTPARNGLFSNMAFAISYGNNDEEKALITRLIQHNGGLILEKGFDELFHVPGLDEVVPVSPSKKTASKDRASASDDYVLEIMPGCETLGFVALVADCHSRRAKYVQALALGLPTLSGKWIIDSLDGSKNHPSSPHHQQQPSTPLPWSKYLLPAGESAYLGGAVRSRTLPSSSSSSFSTSPPAATFANTIQSRDRLLSSAQGVLILTPSKSKPAWDRRRAYAFLTLALGAGRVKRISDLAEAKALLASDPDVWKWIHVDGSLADAAAVVFGGGTNAKDPSAAGASSSMGRKGRKVPGAAAPAAVAAVDAVEEGNASKHAAASWSLTKGGVRIVNDEFVVQSLILGALVD